MDINSRLSEPGSPFRRFVKTRPLLRDRQPSGHVAAANNQQFRIRGIVNERNALTTTTPCRCGPACPDALQQPHDRGRMQNACIAVHSLKMRGQHNTEYVRLLRMSTALCDGHER